MEKAIFAGGCFWCTEAIFQRIKGVESVQPGYTGGTIKNPGYREVCTGRTGHAEAIEITYDRDLVSFETLRKQGLNLQPINSNYKKREDREEHIDKIKKLVIYNGN